MPLPIEIDAPEPTVTTETLPFAELALDEATGDLKITNGQIVILKGAEALVQRLLVRLKFFKGEWFLDLRQGMPYFRAVLVKNPDMGLIQSIFRKAILSMPGVEKIIRLETKLDGAARTLTVSPLEIVVTGGQVFRAQSDELVIQLPEA